MGLARSRGSPRPRPGCPTRPGPAGAGSRRDPWPPASASWPARGGAVARPPLSAAAWRRGDAGSTLPDPSDGRAALEVPAVIVRGRASARRVSAGTRCKNAASVAKHSGFQPALPTSSTVKDSRFRERSRSSCSAHSQQSSRSAKCSGRAAEATASPMWSRTSASVIVVVGAGGERRAWRGSQDTGRPRFHSFTRRVRMADVFPPGPRRSRATRRDGVAPGQQ